MKGFQIIKKPIFTEKARELAKEGKYVFEVSEAANKNEIKKALEEMFGVEIIKVNILKTPKKKRNFRGFLGWKKGLKKALIKVKEGQKIEIFE